MTSEFDQLLDRYAEVAIKIGLNLQPGQRLLIGRPPNSLTPVETAPLVRLIARHAYRAGARLVDVLWGDDQLIPIRLKEAPRDSFEEYPDWQVQTAVEYFRHGDAILSISGRDPDLLKGQDQRLVGKVEQTKAKKTTSIGNYISQGATNWLAVPAVVPGWAAKVFPGTPEESLDAHLWDAIFEVCRIKQSDPVSAWQNHINELAKRSAYLNGKQYASLHYSGPGTDLTIGLPAGHVWMSGSMTNAAGIRFTANIPTEEVFTIPRRDKVDGVVTSTKPLNTGGGLIEKFHLTFSGGKVVRFTAQKGEENLRMMIDTDEGASRLGEVSLVPHSSPISQSGLIFYNTLIDENAACHLALGHALKFNMSNGEKLTDEEFAAAGGNLSAIHTDFMVGSGEIDIDGITSTDSVEPVMRGGEWAFII